MKGSQPMDIEPGHIVKTVRKEGYDTGTYMVEIVYGPCTCPDYVRWINGDDSPSEEHYHFTVRESKNLRGDRFYLNGYVKSGSRYKNVWSDNEILVIGKGNPSEIPGYTEEEETAQLELF